MRLSRQTWPRLPGRELAVINAAGAVFGVVLAVVLVVGYELPGRGAGPAAGAGMERVEEDLAPVVVEVLGPGSGARFRLGGRRLASTDDLTRALGPLAQSGVEVFVRVSHDVPFSEAAEALRACREAGVRSVSLGTGAP